MGVCRQIVCYLGTVALVTACGTEPPMVSGDDGGGTGSDGGGQLPSADAGGPDAFPVCGDGVMQWGEECDDGPANADVTGTCSTQCRMVIHWTRNFNGSGGEANQAEGAASDGVGNVHVVGWRSGDARPARIWICKYDVVGTPLWTHTMSSAANSRGLAVATDPAGNVAAGGTQEIAPAPGPAPTDAWVRKLDKDGNVLWMREHDGAARLDDAVQGITIDRAGNVVAVGFESSSPGGRNIWVRKYDAIGAVLWTRRHEGEAGGDDQARGVATDRDNNVVLVGVETAATGRRGWIRKLDPAGETIWTVTVEGVAATGADIDQDGNIVVSGSQATQAAGSNVWVRKLTPAGSELWTRTYDGTAQGNDAAYDVSLDMMGNVIVAGTESVIGQSRNVWLRKYDPAGEILWTRTHNNGYANGIEQGMAVAADPRGNVIVAGAEEQMTRAVDIWVRKYGP